MKRNPSLNISAAGTEQIARAAEDLNRLTLNLQDLIGRFQIDNKFGTFKHSNRENKQLNYNNDSLQLTYNN